MYNVWRRNARRAAAWSLALSVAAAGGTAASASSSAAPASFADVSPGAWYEANIGWAVEQRIASGYPDGTFRPDAATTEAEFLAMLFRASPSGGVRAALATEPWHAPYYEAAAALGLPVDASRAASPIRRGLAALAIAAAFGEPAASEAEAIEWALREGLSNGKTAPTLEGFAAEAPLTRAEAVAFVRRVKAYADRAAAEAPPLEPPVADAELPPKPSGGGGGGGSGDDEGERPDGPVRAEDNEEERAERLEEAIEALGLETEETRLGLIVSHPEREGGGAMLTKAGNTGGSVQLLDDDNAVVAEAAHALLLYAGVTIDKDRFVALIGQVRRTGANAALKTGGQLVTFVRDASPGQMTVQYTIMD